MKHLQDYISLVLDLNKHNELNTPEIGDDICAQYGTCDNCLSRSACDNVSNTTPVYTQELIEALKKDYPELMI